MKRTQRYARAVACLMILVLLFALGTYTLVSGMHADHECTGDSCAICWCTSMREQLGKLLLSAGFIGAVLAVPTLPDRVAYAAAVPHCNLWTPVCLKVKLSN